MEFYLFDIRGDLLDLHLWQEALGWHTRTLVNWYLQQRPQGAILEPVFAQGFKDDAPIIFPYEPRLCTFAPPQARLVESQGGEGNAIMEWMTSEEKPDYRSKPL